MFNCCFMFESLVAIKLREMRSSHELFTNSFSGKKHKVDFEKRLKGRRVSVRSSRFTNEQTKTKVIGNKIFKFSKKVPIKIYINKSFESLSAITWPQPCSAALRTRILISDITHGWRLNTKQRMVCRVTLNFASFPRMTEKSLGY